MPNLHLRVMGYLLGTGLFLSACNSGSSGKRGGEEAVREPAGSSSVESELLLMILGDFKDGMFRGVSLGNTKDQVKLTETFELFEESDFQLGFTHDTRQLETVDVYYFFSKDKAVVDKIVVDVFLNSKAATDQLWSETVRYYTKAYGEPSAAGSTRINWQQEQFKLDLENVTNGIDNGLKLTFAPLKIVVAIN